MPLLLMGKVAGEKPTRITSKAIALELSRQNADNLNGTNIETMNSGSFKLPGKLFKGRNSSKIIDSKVKRMEFDFFWLMRDEFLTAYDRFIQFRCNEYFMEWFEPPKILLNFPTT